MPVHNRGDRRLGRAASGRAGGARFADAAHERRPDGTEENGFSSGVALSAPNLTARSISLSARAYFGGTGQRWAKLSPPR